MGHSGERYGEPTWIIPTADGSASHIRIPPSAGNNHRGYYLPALSQFEDPETRATVAAEREEYLAAERSCVANAGESSITETPAEIAADTASGYTPVPAAAPNFTSSSDPSFDFTQYWSGSQCVSASDSLAMDTVEQYDPSTEVYTQSPGAPNRTLTRREMGVCTSPTYLSPSLTTSNHGVLPPTFTSPPSFTTTATSMTPDPTAPTFLRFQIAMQDPPTARAFNLDVADGVDPGEHDFNFDITQLYSPTYLNEQSNILAGKVENPNMGKEWAWEKMEYPFEENEKELPADPARTLVDEPESGNSVQHWGKAWGRKKKQKRKPATAEVACTSSPEQVVDEGLEVQDQVKPRTKRNITELN